MRQVPLAFYAFSGPPLTACRARFSVSFSSSSGMFGCVSFLFFRIWRELPICVLCCAFSCDLTRAADLCSLLRVLLCLWVCWLITCSFFIFCCSSNAHWGASFCKNFFLYSFFYLRFSQFYISRVALFLPVESSLEQSSDCWTVASFHWKKLAHWHNCIHLMTRIDRGWREHCWPKSWNCVVWGVRLPNRGNLKGKMSPSWFVARCQCYAFSAVVKSWST